jgi:protein-arginine kinase activator protein McsA
MILAAKKIFIRVYVRIRLIIYGLSLATYLILKKPFKYIHLKRSYNISIQSLGRTRVRCVACHNKTFDRITVNGAYACKRCFDIMILNKQTNVKGVHHNGKMPYRHQSRRETAARFRQKVDG